MMSTLPLATKYPTPRTNADIAQSVKESIESREQNIPADPQPTAISHNAVFNNQESTPDVVQPDANGEFPTPADGALWMANFGIPQTPLKDGKIPRITGWPEEATCDPKQIRDWAGQFPGCNFGSVARNHEFFMFEADSNDVKARFEKTGGKFSSGLMVLSSPGRGHRYYRWTDGVVNISQSEGGTLYKDFSLRVENQQCVSPGSVHPTTGRQYRVVKFGVPDFP